MRSTVLVLLVLAALFGAGPARCEDIAHVLDRSQDMRLAALQVAGPDEARARLVQASFDRLVQSLHLERPVTLRVVRGPLWAEAMHDRVVVANESLGELPEGARLFVLAHELGHVTLGHWSQMSLLFQKWVPGEVTRQRTDAIASLLGRDASALAFRQEFEADAYAARALRTLDVAEADMLAVFTLIGGGEDTATHPSAEQRVAALRAPAVSAAPVAVSVPVIAPSGHAE